MDPSFQEIKHATDLSFDEALQGDKENDLSAENDS